MEIDRAQEACLCRMSMDPAQRQQALPAYQTQRPQISAAFNAHHILLQHAQTYTHAHKHTHKQTNVLVLNFTQLLLRMSHTRIGSRVLFRYHHLSANDSAKIKRTNETKPKRLASVREVHQYARELI